MEKRVLCEHRSVAVVGVSPRPERASYHVADYLVRHGYRVSLVNPLAEEIMGRASYPDLISLPEPVEMINIFRRSDKVMPIVDEAISIGAKVIWMQEGVINHEAAARAESAGLIVIMDKCIMREHASIFGVGGDSGFEGLQCPVRKPNQ